MKTRCLSLLVLACAAAGAAEYTARSYIANGLVAQFDAIENVAYGVHSAVYPRWVNLLGTNVCGHLPLAPLKSYAWNDDSLDLTSGGISEANRLITPGAANLGNQFTLEVSGRSGSDGTFRRWEVYTWANTFETWNNSSEGYLERINGTRFAALTKQLANADLFFATTYSAGRHNAYAWKADGTYYSATRTGSSYSFNGRLAFFTSAASGTKARSIRIYNRVLSEDELKANNVVDQMRFFGKTRTTVVLPAGWSFNAAGALLNAASAVMIAAPSATAARAVTAATFETQGSAIHCTATVEAGTAGVTNALYVAWAESDKGDAITAWPRVTRVRLVPPDATSVAFEMPGAAAAYAQTVHVRLFLAETAYPFDYRLSAVNARNNQYLDSGYFANPRTYASLNCQLNDLTVQQRPFGADEDDTANAFSFSTYINGGGQWAYACRDGNGNWSGSNKTALSEPVTLALDASTWTFSLFSPTYGRVTSTSKATCTQTATHSLCFFADKRKNDVMALHVRNGEFFSAFIAEDDEVLHAWTPCVLGGRPALYDAVAGSLFYSASGTDFLASGTNTSVCLEQGDAVIASCAVGTLPKAVYSVDTGIAPLAVDYALVYTEGGHKYGAAPLTLSNSANDFGGTFTVHEGMLEAAFGAGLAATDRLVLDGGVWSSPHALTNALGTGAGEVEFVAGSRGGFAARAAANTVDLFNDGRTLTYPSALFNPSALLLNDACSTAPLAFANGITGDGTTPNLEISVGADTVRLTRTVTGVNLTKTGAGTLALGAAGNAVGTFTVPEGRARLDSGATLTTSGILELTGTELEASNATITVGGNLTAHGDAKVVLRNSAVAVKGDVWLARDKGGRRGSFVFDGGTLEAPKNLTLGHLINGWSDNSGQMTITNDAHLTVNAFRVEHGDVYQYGGTVCATGTLSGAGSLAIGTTKALHPKYYLYGGTLERTSTSGNFQIGVASNATGSVYVERRGLLKTCCQYPSVGRLRWSKGNLYIRNGGRYESNWPDASLSKFCIADEGSGYLEVASGGELNGVDALWCGSDYTHDERASEVRLLTGGTIRARQVTGCIAHLKSQLFIFDGGTLQVRANPRAPFFTRFLAAQIGVAGGVLDTNGNDVRMEMGFAARSGQSWTAPTTAAAIVACAAFTKTGAGTLTWLGTNTYACATCVSNGVLATACDGVLPAAGILKLAGGAVNLLVTEQTVGTLFGAGAISNGTLTVTGTVWPGGAAGGTLELAGVTANFTQLRYAIGANGACGALKSTTPIGLDGVEIAVDGLENRTGNQRLLLVDAPAVTGTPTCSLPHTSRLLVSGGKLYLGSYTGTTVYLR